jgi:hypothetical protein
MKLYGCRNGRTLRAAWVLEKVGAAHEYVEVDLPGAARCGMLGRIRRAPA